MQKIIIGNWKMNPRTEKNAVVLARSISKGLAKTNKLSVIVAPPFLFIPSVGVVSKKTNGFRLGAQDVFFGAAGGRGCGPFTGEISAAQLRSFGVNFVIVGHSERRALGETNEIINKKIKSILENNMRPVLCVGEKEKNKNEVFPQIIREELGAGFKKIKKTLLKNLVIAYEPVWSVGSGQADNPKNVYEMSLMIRRELYRTLGRKIAVKIPILYGGSVDEKNASFFIKNGRVDGLLIGGASLKSKKFIRITKEASKL